MHQIHTLENLFLACYVGALEVIVVIFSEIAFDTIFEVTASEIESWEDSLFFCEDDTIFTIACTSDAEESKTLVNYLMMNGAKYHVTDFATYNLRLDIVTVLVSNGTKSNKILSGELSSLRVRPGVLQYLKSQGAKPRFLLQCISII